MRPGATRYGAVAITFHWLIALLIIVNFGLGLYFVQLRLSPGKLALISQHKWIGVTVFVLCAARLLWRCTHPAPALAPSLPTWQRHAAHAVHAVLYILMVAAPLSGWLYSSAAGVPTVYLGISALRLPDLLGKDAAIAATLKLVHRVINYSLATLVVAHLAAALKHQLVDRDGTLARMLPFFKTSSVMGKT
ncbi:cytochrome b [Variovorax paradoxus]|uniref:cytochrome b n=1 Tax=Variovorax paradoxus TaxID=34073 RepID=UPI0027D78F3C|nr:cytochrome b [Variovorax paradoxus]